MDPKRVTAIANKVNHRFLDGEVGSEMTHTNNLGVKKTVFSFTDPG